MLHSLALPTYQTVRHLEGKGYAVKRYYQFPYLFFYRKKLSMMLEYLEPGRIYSSILDFGCGKARIFESSLKRSAFDVDSIDKSEKLLKRKYEVIVCGSVLEFVNLKEVVLKLKSMLDKRGMLIVSSPMRNWITSLYFSAIGDRSMRNSHIEIMEELKKHFKVCDYRQWNGLYFSAKMRVR